MSKGKVIIVEADPAIVRTLRLPFEADGFEVEVATTAAEGLDLCRRFIPQAVLVDAELPDAAGTEVCRQLRATTRTRHIHLVVLAQDLDRAGRIAALETGANDVITIPFDPDEVTLRIRNALRRAAADNLTDPVTGLPAGRLIHAQLMGLLRQERDWALLSIDIRNLQSFEALHGFLAAQEVLRSTTQALSEALQQWGGSDDFIGYSGGGRFLVVSTAGQVDALVGAVSERVEQCLQTHHTFRERDQGYMVLDEGGEPTHLPLMSVEVRRVLATDGPFYDIRSLTEALA